MLGSALAVLVSVSLGILRARTPAPVLAVAAPRVPRPAPPRPPRAKPLKAEPISNNSRTDRAAPPSRPAGRPAKNPAAPAGAWPLAGQPTTSTELGARAALRPTDRPTPSPEDSGAAPSPNAPPPVVRDATEAMMALEAKVSAGDRVEPAELSEAAKAVERAGEALDRPRVKSCVDDNFYINPTFAVLRRCWGLFNLRPRPK